MIKERELIEGLDKKRKQNHITSQNVKIKKREIIKEQGHVTGLLHKTISDIFGYPQNSKEASDVKNSLIAFYKGEKEDNEVNIASQMPKEVKQMLIEEFILSKYPDITEEQKANLKKKSADLLSYTSEYVSYDKQLRKLSNLNSVSETYRMNKRLFKAAAAHRLAIEEDVNLPDAVIRYERSLGIPPKDKRAVEYLKSILPTFEDEDVRKLYKKEDGTIPTQSELEQSLIADIAKLDSIFPKELDSIVEKLLGQSVNPILSSLFDNVKTAVKANDKAVIERFCSVLDIKNDKTALLKILDRYQNKLNENPTNEEVQDAIRVLCYEDRVMVGDLIVGSFFQTLQTGISQETMDELKSRFGDENLIGGLQEMQDRYAKMRYDHELIFDKWHIPTSREEILNKLEKRQEVMPRKKLDILHARFKDIQAQLNENEKITNSKERRKANEKAYVFTEPEQEILDLIDKNFSKMKKYNKVSYQNLNAQMKNALEEQYAYIGMLNGQFWVREEGSSGLVGNEQVRILEQMTGKPYHLEHDVNNAAAQIKEGKGSGILSTSVDHEDYAFHAQYIPSVTSEIFTNPVTGKTVVEDILWTDNSWGKSEKDYFWNGRNGFNYTDYGSKYGWKDGFILHDTFKIGLPVKDVHLATGHHAEDDEDFSLFNDVVLQGAPVSAYQKLVKMFSYIFQMGDGETFYTKLEEAIARGERINPDYLTKLDQFAEAKTERIEKRIKKEINSKEDFDKLPDSDELKLSFNKIALHQATDNPELKELVSDVQTVEELEDAKNEMIDTHTQIFYHLIAKSQDTIDEIEAFMKAPTKTVVHEIKTKFGEEKTEEEVVKILSDIFPTEEEFMNLSGSLNDLKAFILNKIPSVAVENFNSNESAVHFIQRMQKEVDDYIEKNVRINSLKDSSLTSKPLEKEFIAAIDKYLEPQNDEELLTLIQQMQNASFEQVQGFFDALKPEDVGIKIKPAYDYLHQFKMYSTNVRKVFFEVVGAEEIAKLMNCSDEKSTISTPDEYFRALYVKLGEMDVQKFIKGYKNEAFEKYKVRQAFPDPVVMPDSVIVDAVDKMIKEVNDRINSISSTECVISVFKSLNKLSSRYFETTVFADLASGKKVSISENEEFLNALLTDLAEFEGLIINDESLSALAEPVSNIIDCFQKAQGFVGGRKLAYNIAKMFAIFKDWENSGISLNRFVEEKKSEIKGLNEGIKLIANTNVEPRYRDQAIQMLKDYVSIYRDSTYQYELDDILEEIKGFICERHITKNPAELLKSCVNILQEGKKESPEYQVLRGYLMDSLKVAQQTKIQYQLVQNQHEGISSKTRDLLPMFGVTLVDGTWADMNSDQGFLYLINQLQNVSDNHVTLNLFLSQSGLAKEAVKAVIDNMNMEKSKEVIDEKVELTHLYLDHFVGLLALNNEYLEQNQGKFTSLKDAINNLSNFIKTNTSDIENGAVFNTFTSYLDSIELGESLLNIKSTMIDDLLNSFINDATDRITMNINAQIDFIEEVKNLFDDRYQLINGIQLSEVDDSVQLREKFNAEYSEWSEYVDAKMDELTERIEGNNLAQN